MPDVARVVVPLVIFFIMGVLVVYLIWRVVVVGGEVRRDAAVNKAAIDLAHRVDTSLTELAALVDEVRRRKSPPETTEASLQAAADALSHYEMEAEPMAKHKSASGAIATMAAEIERAHRAVDLIEHGRSLMADMSEDHFGEGETSVKRGYLNLVHAREAIRACGQQIASDIE
jgi:hypothetical protein